MINNWNFIKQFNGKFKNPVSDEFICVICRTMLNNAHQGACGCKYCYRCMCEYFINNKECPGGKRECQESNNYERVIDYSTNLKLSHLVVKCTEENCKFEDELCKIEMHIKECKKTYENCPFSYVGCSQNNINIEIMLNHLANAKLNHTKLLIDFVKHLEMISMKISNKLQDMDNIQSQLETNVKLLNQATERIEKRLNKNLDESAKREKMKDERIMQLEMVINETRSKLEQFINDKKKQNPIEESRYVLEEFQKLKTTNKKMLVSKILILENRLKTENTFYWKIDNFSEKMKSIELGENIDLFSASFSAYKNGYRIKLRMKLNGNLNPKTRFLSVFFGFQEGDFDELISWPVKDDIVINLINQNNGNSDVSCCLNHDSVSNEDKSVFNRPNSTTHYYGNCRFVGLSELTKPFIKDDAIILTCYVISRE